MASRLVLDTNGAALEVHIDSELDVCFESFAHDGQVFYLKLSEAERLAHWILDQASKHSKVQP